ncbi:MAG: lipocalin family protein [Gammaproteobacteria bacterium]
MRWGTIRWVGTGIHSSSPTSARSCSIVSASATGSTDIYSAGTLVSPDGTLQRLGHQDVEIATLSHSKSPRSGTLYPARTRLNLELVLEVAPLLADQELDVSVRYWEGAIAVRGTAQGVPVNGRGYLELTGYAE